MTLFVLIAVAMVAVALGCVLVPLLRTSAAGVAREASNVTILRDQLRELDADVGAGTMPRDRYEQAKQELLQRAIEESRGDDSAVSAAPQSTAWTVAILGSAIPIAALVLYVVLGNHGAFAPVTAQQAPAAGEHKVTRQDVEALAEKLAAKLKNEPANVDGWVMLARTYQALERHADAAIAFDRAVAILPDNADLLADYADSLATTGGFRGKTLELIEHALKVDPRHWKALALAGTAAFNRKDYKSAVAYWERMKATVPPSSPLAGSIDASIAEARELGGIKTPSAAASAPTSASTAAAATAGAMAAATPPTAAAATRPGAAGASPGAAGSAPAAAAGSAPAPAGGKIAGTVKLAPELASKVSPTDTVYIFARAVDGPRMPVAILRRQAKDLPVAFTLDDSMAMTPNMALSNFAAVIVGARVSKSGSATPQSGDLEGLSSAVKIGATDLAVVIDRALP